MSPPTRRRRLLLAAPAVGYAALILLLSSRPGTDLPSVGIPYGDKGLHVLEYFLLGVLLLLPLRGFGWQGRAFVLAAGLAFAALDETFQGTVPGRIGDAADVAADVAGLLLAVALDAAVHPARAAAKPS